MIRLRVSKGRLHEAKVGALEESKQVNEKAGKFFFGNYLVHDVLHG